MPEKRERRQRDRSPKHSETHPKTQEQKIGYIQRKMASFTFNMEQYRMYSGRDMGNFAHLSRIGNLAWSIRQIDECLEKNIPLPQPLIDRVDTITKAYVGTEEKSVFAEDCLLASNGGINSINDINIIKNRFEQIVERESGENFP